MIMMAALVRLLPGILPEVIGARDHLEVVAVQGLLGTRGLGLHDLAEGLVSSVSVQRRGRTGKLTVLAVTPRFPLFPLCKSVARRVCCACPLGCFVQGAEPCPSSSTVHGAAHCALIGDVRGSL